MLLTYYALFNVLYNVYIYYQLYKKRSSCILNFLSYDTASRDILEAVIAEKGLLSQIIFNVLIPMKLKLNRFIIIYI